MRTGWAAPRHHAQPLGHHAQPLAPGSPPHRLRCEGWCGDNSQFSWDCVVDGSSCPARGQHFHLDGVSEAWRLNDPGGPPTRESAWGSECSPAILGTARGKPPSQGDLCVATSDPLHPMAGWGDGGSPVARCSWVTPCPQLVPDAHAALPAAPAIRRNTIFAV